MDSKRALRQKGYIGRSRQVPSTAYEQLLEPLLHSAIRVASFVPLPDEPGLAPREGWLLPVVLPDLDLDWAVHDGRLAIARGLSEPVGPRLGVAAISGCDLILVPALLVDRAGNRLGKGGGCYDRALRRTTGLTVALVNDDELVDALPREPHDVRVHAVITPSEGVLHLPTKM